MTPPVDELVPPHMRALIERADRIRDARRAELARAFRAAYWDPCPPRRPA